MNKTELIKEISNKTKLSKDQATKAVNEIMASITHALQNGEEVKINDFGAFQVTEKNERKGRNPQTGEEITIPSSKAPQFKAAKTLKDAVNGRNWIEELLAAGKVTDEEAKVLAFVVEENRKAKEENRNLDDLVVVETKKAAKAIELDFKETEMIVNRLIGKRILNTQNYTSEIDSVYLRAGYRKFI
ncbi:nucleoid DNA-binding protein [Planomicrobium soli]|uniref:Nucleoid DNA-binding protein n=1 Tax=Planomicrobium soli TaxID=1176648 RepID=A0A2P8GQI7_9BACL|nr:nucleoid DNA-binding protein [Planomicrobium soli]